MGFRLLIGILLLFCGTAQASFSKPGLPSACLSGTLRAAVTNLTVNGQAGVVYQDLTYAAPGVGLADGANSFEVRLSAVTGLNQTNVVTANLPETVTLHYDGNGNLTNDGFRSFEYDDLDRLSAITVSNGWRSEFEYDALWRRRITRDFAWTNGWVLTNETRYVHAGRQVIQERDALNQPLVTYTLGMGLTPLARTASPLLAPSAVPSALPATAFYHADGNLNVTALVNPEGFVKARYLYDPFGNRLSQSGPLAKPNAYRFSSKPVHPNSGLYYYGFRFYEPNLQRWMNQDPIGIAGGINVHEFVRNRPTGLIDLLGLDVHPFQAPWGDYYNGDHSVSYYYGDTWQEDVGLFLYNTGAGIVNTIGGIGAFFSWLSDTVLGPGGNEFAMLYAPELALTKFRIPCAAKTGIHKNSLEYIGETHVYRIKGPDGTTFKIGESARGVRVSDALSIRAEQQVRRLQRETGETFSSEIRKTFGSKAEARDYERRLIERFRRMYGEDALPGNKSYH